MKKFLKNLVASLMLVAFVFCSASAFAQADVSNSITAGQWKEARKLVGDVYQVAKITRLTASVSTTDRLGVPSNALNKPTLLLNGQSLNANGISITQYLYPTSNSFVLTGGTVSYTDAVSATRALADVTSASPLVSDTMPDNYAGLVVTGGSTISTSEILELRLLYTVPKECRWPRC